MILKVIKNFAHIVLKRAFNESSLYLDGEKEEIIFQINAEKMHKNSETIIKSENFFFNSTKIILSWKLN